MERTLDRVTTIRGIVGIWAWFARRASILLLFVEVGFGW
jgi:hypothetical protein